MVPWLSSTMHFVLIPALSLALSTPTVPKKVVVIGGGWAGYTAAETLSASTNCEVVLLEASPKAAGGLAGGWRTPSGRPVEAGIHGFWREYLNTFAMIDKIGVSRDEILTPYLPSALVSKNGPVAVAPVLATGEASESASLTPNKFLELLQYSPIAAASTLAGLDPLKQLADLLPAPLDTALLADFSPTSPLTFADRASGIGLLAAWADFDQEDPESWARYDDVSAEKLFKDYGGVSDGLYDELVAPLLHVLPMGPGEDISAAAALSCFHVFALQSRGAFDVRWCRGGITEKIFVPWQERLEARGNVRLQGGARVSCIERDADSGRLAVAILGDEGDEPLLADAVVLAVGATSAAKLVSASPALSALAACRRFDELRGITCVAVRLYLSPHAGGRTGGLKGGAHDSTLLPPAVAEAMRASPVHVVGPEVGGMSELKETGFCVYDLQRMHDEHAAGDLGVLEVDFYRADDLAALDDDAVAAFALKAAAAALGVPPTSLSPNLIVDQAVVRARSAVSHFCRGSAALSPGVRLGDGVFACGDWLDRTGHASWSTEKAVVTGKQAAAAVGRELALQGVDGSVIPAAEDTVQLATLRQAARAVRAASGATDLPPPAPWVALKALLP